MSLDARDVKRACVRGAVIASACAGSLALATQWDYRWWPDFINRHSVYYCELDLTPAKAGLFGAFIGLLATPVALLEISRTKQPRDSGKDLATGCGVYVALVLLIALAALQAIYTHAIADGKTSAQALSAVGAVGENDDALGYTLLCFAAAAPVTMTVYLRIVGAAWWSQSLLSLAIALTLSTPFLLLASAAPDANTPVRALTVGIFATAILLGPVSSLADRVTLVPARRLGGGAEPPR